MSTDFDLIYDECLDRLINGQDINECLALYPEYREELEPLLRTFIEANAVTGLMPSPEAKTKGRAYLYREMNLLRTERLQSQTSRLSWLLGLRRAWIPASAVIIILAIVIGLSVGIPSNDEGSNDIVAVTSTPTPTSTVSPTPEPTPSLTPAMSPSQSPETSATPTPLVSPSPTPAMTTSPTTDIGSSPTPIPSVSPSPVTNPTPQASPSPTPGPTIIASVGFLEIRVTDAPSPDITAIDMTVSNIEVHLSEVRENQPDLNEPDEQWQTVISDTRTFELLSLRGIEEVLGTAELPTGHYTQIRLNIDSVVVTADDRSYRAKLPSTSMKLTGAFDIEQDKKTAVTLDFDAEESVHFSGNNMPIFKPIVKVEVRKPSQG